jgi:hypothetical protein
MLNIIKKYFDLSYENDASASYLILSLKQTKDILNYQIEMIAHNPVNSILPLSVNQKDNRISIVYKINLKQPLDQFLKNKKLKKDELIQILKSIFKIVLNCKNYLLNYKCFLLDEQYIYINPSTLETSLVYVPVVLDYDFNTHLKDFITRLLAKLVSFDEQYSKDNFVQAILNSVKDESFSMIGLDKLLSEIRNGTVWEEQGENYDKAKPEKDKKEISISSKISIPREVYLGQSVKIQYKRNIILAAGLAQVLLAILILLISKAMFFNQKIDMSSMIGLLIIAAVVDFIVLRKFFDKKNLEIIDTPITPYKERTERPGGIGR